MWRHLFLGLFDDFYDFLKLFNLPYYFRSTFYVLCFLVFNKNWSFRVCFRYLFCSPFLMIFVVFWFLDLNYLRTLYNLIFIFDDLWGSLNNFKTLIAFYANIFTDSCKFLWRFGVVLWYFYHLMTLRRLLNISLIAFSAASFLIFYNNSLKLLFFYLFCSSIDLL